MNQEVNNIKESIETLETRFKQIQDECKHINVEKTPSIGCDFDPYYIQHNNYRCLDCDKTWDDYEETYEACEKIAKKLGRKYEVNIIPGCNFMTDIIKEQYNKNTQNLSVIEAEQILKETIPNIEQYKPVNEVIELLTELDYFTIRDGNIIF